jgi:uncharacterized damage-inducible protein DinB
MIVQPYSQLVRYKQWADNGLLEVAERHYERLDSQNQAIFLRVLDHIHAVDRIFRHHLLGSSHGFAAPRSGEMPGFCTLAAGIRETDAWYAAYVDGLTERDFEQPVEFVFTNGSPACMRRGEIILHLCLHGTYHRGNAGIVLQLTGITPNDDRLTDFLAEAA